MFEILVLLGNEELSLSTSARIPNIQSPKDILVEVHAASVNPIDVMMRGKCSQGSSLIRVPWGQLSEKCQRKSVIIF